MAREAEDPATTARGYRPPRRRPKAQRAHASGEAGDRGFSRTGATQDQQRVTARHEQGRAVKGSNPTIGSVIGRTVRSSAIDACVRPTPSVVICAPPPRLRKSNEKLAYPPQPSSIRDPFGSPTHPATGPRTTSSAHVQNRVVRGKRSGEGICKGSPSTRKPKAPIESAVKMVGELAGQVRAG